MHAGRAARRATTVAAALVGLAACSPNAKVTATSAPAGSAVTVAAESGTVGGSIVDGGAKLPPSLADVDVPLPADGLVRSQVDEAGPAKKYDLTYNGADLSALVANLRNRLSGAGYTISDEYDSKVKNVPSAGFVAKNKQWIVTVGGTGRDGAPAAVSVSVVSAA